MSEAISTTAFPRARPARRRVTHIEPSRHVPLFVFFVLSLLVSMSVGQEEEIELESVTYWLLIVPAVILPLFDVPHIVQTLLGQARLLLVLVIVGGAWHALTGDGRAALQVGLLVWVLAWLSTPNASFRVNDLLWAYLALVAVGIGVDMWTELNPWGLLPGHTREDYGIWRISFFPNIANTGMLSLAVLLVLTRNWSRVRTHPAVFAVAMYFLVLSFVRTALIAALLYLALRWWFGRLARPSPKRLFWTALIVAVGANVMIASSALALEFGQQFPLISRLLLRGESSLSPDEIFEQMYRPWLWWQHLTLFGSSPELMGWGTFDFKDMKTDELVVGHAGIGSEALPTRLLASYGLVGILFTAYLLARLRSAARVDDRWACACFPSVFLLMMNWGSVFHPANAFFAIFLLMVVRGSRGFLDR